MAGVLRSGFPAIKLAAQALALALNQNGIEPGCFVPQTEPGTPRTQLMASDTDTDRLFPTIDLIPR